MDIKSFLTEHQLGEQYKQQIQRYFIALAQQLAQAKPQGDALVVMLNGAQGSGKSTLAEFLVQWLNDNTHFNAHTRSIDDFYLDKAQRQALAKQVHPLFATRGVPGTHDTELLINTLELIRDKQAVVLPRFEKATDNPQPKSQWQKVDKPIDIFILEGWCVGSKMQECVALNTPVNALERDKDSHGCWRRCVNSALANDYAKVFAFADITIMLKAPSFAVVQQWRTEQEHKLIAKTGVTADTMSDEQIAEFISHYQRITEHNLAQLPAHSDVVFELDEQRNITVAKNTLRDQGPQKPIIFTDLDGTLLNHDDYRFDDALELMEALKAQHIPIIINTSKTAAEVQALQQKMGLHQPFIIENGAALYIPKQMIAQAPTGAKDKGDFWQLAFAPSVEQLQSFIAHMQQSFAQCFTPFSEFSVAQLCELTSLDSQSAALALQREFSEPLYWQRDEQTLREFTDEVAKHGYHVERGGRFVHLTQGANKGLALASCMELFASYFNTQLTSIALGDSGNDEAMLNAADTAIVIKNPASKAPIITNPNTLFSASSGAKGWAQTLQSLPLIEQHISTIKTKVQHG